MSVTADHRGHRVRLALGLALVVLGIVLWLGSGAAAYGLVSGVGVVVAYAAAEPWLARWRNR